MSDVLKERGPAFVAGATGFTGREVVRILCEKGLPTVAHVRPDSPRLTEWRERFKGLGAEVDTTAWEEGAMAGSMSRIQPACIFALLGTTRSRMKKVASSGGDPGKANYEAVDYGMTSILISAAKSCGRSPRFIYLSAAGVNSRARSAYYAVRFRAEQELITSGLPYIIARPSFITGPGRDDARPAERAGAAVVDSLLWISSFFGGRRIRDRYSSTTNTALAGGLVRLALAPDAAGGIYESESLR